MAGRIAEAWPGFVAAGPTPGRATFDFWAFSLRGRTTQPFITVAFLVHLLAPTRWPIIDQHTFRSMNALMSGVRKDWRTKLRPRTYDDLVLYTAFFGALRVVWSETKKPDRRLLDRALMVYGQDLKRNEWPPVY